MGNSKVLKIFGVILILAGLIVTAFGIHKKNDAESMLKTHEAAGRLGGYSEYYEAGVKAWTKHINEGKTIEIAGLVTSGIGLVFCLVGITQANADERAKYAATRKTEKCVGTSTKEKLATIEDLKASGMISEEEYKQKRKEILDNLTSY